MACTEFIYTRFLVPYRCGHQGIALFMDSGMLRFNDIMELLNRARRRASLTPGNWVVVWSKIGLMAPRALVVHSRIALSERWLSLKALLRRQSSYCHGDINLTFRISSGVELQRVKSKGQPFILNEFLGLLTPGSVYYDIGANIGIFALPAAKMVGPDGLVVAFEPAAANYHRLVENVELNHLDNVLAFSLALGSENRTCLLYRPTDRLGEGGNSLLMPRVPKGTASRIQLARLDDLVSLWGFALPNFAKIDVEGGELEVLAGMPRILANEELHTLVCEVRSAHGGPNGQQPNDEAVAQVLAPHGFVEIARRDSGDGLNNDVLYVKPHR